MLAHRPFIISSRLCLFFWPVSTRSSLCLSTYVPISSQFIFAVMKTCLVRSWYMLAHQLFDLLLHLNVDSSHPITFLLIFLPFAFLEILPIQWTAHSTSRRRTEIDCRCRQRTHTLRLHPPQMRSAVLQRLFRFLCYAEYLPDSLFRYDMVSNLIFICDRWKKKYFSNELGSVLLIYHFFPSFFVYRCQEVGR